MFDRRKFIETNLNDGFHYWYEGCGCIKGAIANAYGVCDLAMELQSQIREEYPKLATLCDVAERILLSGYPQKAKMFILDSLDKYDVEVPKKYKEGYDGFVSKHAVDVEVKCLTSVRPSGFYEVLQSSRFTPLATKVKTRLQEPANVK